MKVYFLLWTALFSFVAFAGISQLRFDGQKVISSGSMTGTATINGTTLDLDQRLGYSCQAVWTGTPNGAIKLQASDDIASSAAAVTNWTDVANSSVSISGAAGNTMWSGDPVDFRWLRVTYTNTSSTGTLNATCGFKH